MKKILLTVIAAIGFALCANAQTIVGTWKMEAENSVAILVFTDSGKVIDFGIRTEYSGEYAYSDGTYVFDSNGKKLVMVLTRGEYAGYTVRFDVRMLTTEKLMIRSVDIGSILEYTRVTKYSEIMEIKNGIKDLVLKGYGLSVNW